MIIKADDFLGDKTYFLEKAIENKIKVSVGVIGRGLENYSQHSLDLLKSEYIQPFNHSYYHLLSTREKEFYKTGYDYQKESILKTQQIVKEKTGIEMKTIGFVANASDDDTIKLMSEMDFIIYYVIGSYNYDKMKATGRKIIDVGGDVLQIHPFCWSNEEVDKFFNDIKDNKFIFPNE